MVKVNRHTEIKILLIMPIMLIVMAFVYGDINDIYIGLLKGIKWNNRLVSDSFSIMGVSATLFNSGLLGILTIIFYSFYKLKPNGLLISAFYLMMGFGFFGKNLINIMPIMLGGVLYSIAHKKPFKNYLISTLLSTNLAPLISSLALAYNSAFIGVIVASIVGIIIGFIMPVVSMHAVQSHGGYSLYNMGFATGLVAMVIYSVTTSFGLNFYTHYFVYDKFPLYLYMGFFLVFLLYILIGLYYNNYNVTQYNKLLKKSGKLVSDFTRMVGFPISLINMGILGIITLIIVTIAGKLDGAIISGMFCVVGFASFGKHPVNTIPIMIGIFIGSRILGMDNMTILVMTMFLGTTLAPISGDFGWIWGIIVGVLHLLFVVNISKYHGGVNLYNNGLSAGIIVMIILPIIRMIKGEYE